MASFLIKRTTTTNKVVKIIKLKNTGYEFNPKNKSVTKIIVKDPLLIQKILVIKFNNAINKLSKVIYNIISNGENDEESSVILLNEINRLRSILLNKYRKYLSKQQEKHFLDQLQLLEFEICGGHYSFNLFDINLQEEKNRRGK